MTLAAEGGAQLALYLSVSPHMLGSRERGVGGVAAREAH